MINLFYWEIKTKISYCTMTAYYNSDKLVNETVNSDN